MRRKLFERLQARRRKRGQPPATAAVPLPRPRNGELIVHCGHLPPVHFLRTNFPTPFTAPDGTSGMVSWVLQCDRCLDEKTGKFAVNGHGYWDGTRVVKSPTLRRSGDETKEEAAGESPPPV